MKYILLLLLLTSCVTVNVNRKLTDCQNTKVPTDCHREAKTK